MSPSHAHLKASSGWFAAGVEVQRAATLLSDAGFKLYVWICLHAERGRGCLQVTVDHLATQLNKSADETRACLLELRRAGVCQYGPANVITVNDRFWPYTRPLPSLPNVDEAELYVNAVKRTLLAYSCVSTSFTPADDRIAAEWYRSGVSLEVVERAVQLGCLRKYAALINHGCGTPITTLTYFRSLIEEVAHSGATVDYWQYVRIRLGDLDRRWRRRREQPPEETK